MAYSLASSGTLLAGLWLLPLAVGDFWIFQFGLYFLYAIAALGIGICWGQAGFLPLGQAMFVGLGAYLGGFSLIHFGDSLLLYPLLLLSAIVPGLLAYLIGQAVFRGRTESGPYFALITLALSLLTFQIATNWKDLTGGFNGLMGIPSLPGFDDFGDIYYVIALALALAIAATRWLLRAPIGVLWRAVAQNERRLSFFGYDTAMLKALAFGASGVLAGIGGVLYAPQQGLVTPQLSGFLLSAELVIWTAVGGRSRLFGPVIGVVLVGTLTAELRDTVMVWELLVAVLFLAVVLFLPNGVAGLAAPLTRLLERRRYGAEVAAPPSGRPDVPITLEIDNVSAAAGEVKILDDLSLTFDRPGIHCIIGPNGAGKTSIFNMLTGDLAAQGGQVRVDDQRVEDRSAARMALMGVGRKFQIPSVFPDLSISDNLNVALWGGRASIVDLLRPGRRRWSSPTLDTLRDRFPFLADGNRPARVLSHGQRQILELVMALIAEPRLLLLDEPCAGLSAEETRQVMAVVLWARDNLPVRIVIIEHDMTLVRELADHVFVVHQGRLLASGSVEEIQADPLVRDVYVGVGA